MPRRVVITADAESDLTQLYDYLADNASIAQAERSMDRLLKASSSLARNPERGSRPHELMALGYRDYRQLVLRPWRIVYGVEPARVVVYLIADGRRDLRSLLARRLLGG